MKVIERSEKVFFKPFQVRCHCGSLLEVNFEYEVHYKTWPRLFRVGRPLFYTLCEVCREETEIPQSTIDASLGKVQQEHLIWDYNRW